MSTGPTRRRLLQVTAGGAVVAGATAAGLQGLEEGAQAAGRGRGRGGRRPTQRPEPSTTPSTPPTTAPTLELPAPDPSQGVLDVYVNEGFVPMVDGALVYLRGFGGNHVPYFHISKTPSRLLTLRQGLLSLTGKH